MVRELIINPGRDLRRECLYDKGTPSLHFFGSNYSSFHPSFLPFIHYFIHSFSKHLPNAWHYAKCYGYKDKTWSISCRSQHVIDKTEAGRGDRWIAMQCGSTKVEGCRVPWVHLCQCPHPLGTEEGAQSPSSRIIICPIHGTFSKFSLVQPAKATQCFQWI